ncbi:hypothetical protein BANRA_05220 [Klebsiella pneumoniae]|nr:hypothetical protein BANRA_05220 [Klebsiella pneumoniae]
MRRLQQQPPAIAMNTPYLRHHHIVALLQSGLREEAVAEIKAYWGDERLRRRHLLGNFRPPTS